PPGEAGSRALQGADRVPRHRDGRVARRGPRRRGEAGDDEPDGRHGHRPDAAGGRRRQRAPGRARRATHEPLLTSPSPAGGSRAPAPSRPPALVQVRPVAVLRRRDSPTGVASWGRVPGLTPGDARAVIASWGPVPGLTPPGCCRAPSRLRYALAGACSTRLAGSPRRSSRLRSASALTSAPKRSARALSHNHVSMITTAESAPQALLYEPNRL